LQLPVSSYVEQGAFYGRYRLPAISIVASHADSLTPLTLNCMDLIILRSCPAEQFLLQRLMLQGKGIANGRAERYGVSGSCFK
jgi:hypothetical protein